MRNFATYLFAKFQNITNRKSTLKYMFHVNFMVFGQIRISQCAIQSNFGTLKLPSRPGENPEFESLSQIATSELGPKSETC